MLFSYGTQCIVVWLKYSDVSEDPYNYDYPLKRRVTSTGLDYHTSQNAETVFTLVPLAYYKRVISYTIKINRKIHHS